MTVLPEVRVGVDALHACGLFAGVDEAELEVIAGQMRSRKFRNGETIFHQDDPGDALHVVVSGAVKIVLPSAEDGEPAIMATLQPGDFFGALALLDGDPRSATAVALGRTETLVLRREAFLELVDSDRSLRVALLASLSREIRSITAHVQDLHFLDLPGRLARRILREAGDETPQADGSILLPWPYTQSELAGMIGGSRQSVNRLLADLVDEGLIALRRDTLVIPDPAALERSIQR
ncbi:MAG TPA: Crp/Fnr family transcriptional regulator [Candidatus Limnocylindrales bacterium]|nr:Crp/Fnr family transcriptional regulator [Candidatus Limnocylindrales bacterium]